MSENGCDVIIRIFQRSNNQDLGSVKTHTYETAKSIHTMQSGYSMQQAVCMEGQLCLRIFLPACLHSAAWQALEDALQAACQLSDF